MTSLLQKSSRESLNRCSRTDGQVKREISPKSNKTVVEVSIMNSSEPFSNYVENCKCLNHKIYNESMVETSKLQLTIDNCKNKHTQRCINDSKLFPAKNYRKNTNDKVSNFFKSDNIQECIKTS